MITLEELATNEEIQAEYRRTFLLNLFQKICVRMERSPEFKKHVQTLFRESHNKQLTVTGGVYTRRTLTEDTTFYRVYSNDSNKIGGYMSRTPQNGGMQSQFDLALNPDWGNSALYVEKVTVPKGTVIYEGTAAPQVINGGAGYLPGGGNQVYIPNVESGWFH